MSGRALSVDDLLHGSNDHVGFFQLHVMAAVCMFQCRSSREAKDFGPDRFALFRALVHSTVCFACNNEHERLTI